MIIITIIIVVIIIVVQMYSTPYTIIIIYNLINYFSIITLCAYIYFIQDENSAGRVEEVLSGHKDRVNCVRWIKNRAGKIVLFCFNKNIIFA